MQCKHWWVCWLLGWGAGPLWAMNLAEAVQLGLEQHPHILSADAQVGAAEALLQAAQAGYWPSISLAGGPQRLHADHWGYEATVQQMLYDWGRVKSKIDGATAAHRQSQASLWLARGQAVLDVAEAYLDVWLAQQQREGLEGYVQELQRIWEMAQVRSNSGYADRSEAERALLEITRSHDLQATEDARLRSAQQQLRILTGAAVAPRVEQPVLRSDGVVLPGDDVWQRIHAAPGLIKAQEETQRAQAEVEAAQAAFYPQLHLEASAVRRSIDGRMLNDSTLMLRLHATPFQGNSLSQGLASARKRKEAARWNEEAVAREMGRELESWHSTQQLLSERQRILAVQQEQAAQLALLYAEQFQAGRRDIVDLLTIHRESMELQRQRRDYAVQQLRMQLRIAAKLGLIEELVL